MTSGSQREVRLERLVRMTRIPAAGLVALLVAGCDSATGPDLDVLLEVIATPTVARLGVDTVAVTWTVQNVGSGTAVITEIVSELRRVPSGESVIRIATRGSISIAAGDSMSFAGLRLIGALDRAGEYEVIISLNGGQAASADTFQVVL